MVTRSHSFPEGVDEREVIYKTACDLLMASDPSYKKVRLLGISISNFGQTVTMLSDGEAGPQLQLF